MKLKLVFVLSLLICLPVCYSEEQKMTPEMQEMMKKWTDYATPAAPHKGLQNYVGTWDATVNALIPRCREKARVLPLIHP